MTLEYYQKLTNDGDICNFIVTNELLSNKKNPVCFDIGAFHGVWGEGIFRFTSPNAHIYFFEPNPENFVELQKNMEEFKGATLLNMAISDKNGTLSFKFEGPTSNSRTSENTVNVQCSTIDKFFQAHQYVDIVKIDTEGHDMNVLKTLAPFVSEKRVGAIVTEFSVFWYGGNPEEVFEATSIIYEYFKAFKYCYALSRNGEPFLVGPINSENFQIFIGERFINNIQSDLYFMNQEITTIPIYKFKSGTYYV